MSRYGILVALIVTAAQSILADSGTNQNMGRLGYPIGTLLTIEGQEVAPYKVNEFEVLKVNGQELAKPIRIRVGNMGHLFHNATNTICKLIGTEVGIIVKPVFDPATGMELQQSRNAEFTIRRLVFPPTITSAAEKQASAMRQADKERNGPELGPDPQMASQLIENAPFDPSVRKNLWNAKGRAVKLERPHALTQKVKALYRERLREKPDPDLTFQLAAIIHDQLAGTDLRWPSRGQTFAREDPAENYVSLGQVLELGLRSSQTNSQLLRTFGVGLGKLRLLQGDWEGMNDALKRLGDAPVPTDSRAWRCAPPEDWSKGLEARWGLAAPSVRSGDCTLEFRIEKAGQGLKGVHVLAKRAPGPTSGRLNTGIRTDTLFWQPCPLPEEYGSFGYGGEDRAQTRYAVSDESGIVRFEKLPQMAVEVEVLVPAANFPETGWAWDLWMEVAPGEFRIAKTQGRERIDPEKAPAAVMLKPGETVRYPKLVVRPLCAFDIADLQRVDKDRFVLTWPGLDAVASAAIDHYELAMHLSMPDSSPPRDAMSAPVIRSAKEIVKGTQWRVGEKGVGGLRLWPGNIYVFEVRAVDVSGAAVARWREARVWAPWTDRETDPPYNDERDDTNSPPIYSELWGEGEGGSVYGEPLWQRIKRFLRDYPRLFEHDYLRVVNAWHNWHEHDVAGAREECQRLAQELPRGNLARGTAVWLLAQMTEGKAPPKRLEFVPDADAK